MQLPSSRVSKAGGDVLPRPRLLDTENQQRSEFYQVRHQLLIEDFDAEQIEWMTDVLGADVSDARGVPDTALNPMASQTRQLTTPGLYGRTPTVTAPPGGEELTGPEGHLQAMGFWVRNQWLQYLTVGTGIYLRRFGVDAFAGEVPRLWDRLVDPADCVVWVDDTDPLRILKLWELRVRSFRRGEQIVRCYAWDQWELHESVDSSGKRTVTGSMRVVEITGVDGTLGEDISGAVLRGRDGTYGALEGDRYEWVDAETGHAYLPWVPYRAVDTGEFWPLTWRKGLHRGTMRACAHWTFTSWAAHFATGEHGLVGGVDQDAVPGLKVQRGHDDREPNATPQLTMRIHPGSLTFLPTAEGKQLQYFGIGPGANLGTLSNYANMYQMLLAIGDGLHPTDATRQSANPTSGAALEITATSRREFSLQVLPLFRDSDLAAIRICALLLRGVGVNVPTSGYSLTYHTIALSPTEQEDLRAELEWEEERGQVSPIDVHQRLNPGRTREQAIDEVVRAKVDSAIISSKVAEEMKRLGLDGGEEKAANPFASVGLPALVQAGIISAAAARKLLGVGEDAAPAPIEDAEEVVGEGDEPEADSDEITEPDEEGSP